MDYRAWGLVVWAAVVGLNAALLGIDAALYSQHLQTLTEFARRNPWATTAVIALNALGLVGLAVHLSDGHQE